MLLLNVGRIGYSLDIMSEAGNEHRMKGVSKAQGHETYHKQRSEVP